METSLRAASKTIATARRLRRTMTLPEVILWTRLRQQNLAGLRFRRQHPVGPYVLDFFCAESRLCVEVDGAAHDSPEVGRHDERRDHWLTAQGIHVLRFPAADILDDNQLDRVLDAIAYAASCRAPSTGYAGPPPP